MKSPKPSPKRATSKPSPVVTATTPTAPPTVPETIAEIEALLDRSPAVSTLIAERKKSSVLDIKAHAALHNAELLWGELLHKIRAELTRWQFHI